MSRRYDSKPQVDPGVFVITHIDSCRNGAGYCILGYTCQVDKDFIADDLKGHCRGLSKAFNPKANFVCCRENPKTMEPNKLPAGSQHIIDAGYSEEMENGGNKSSIQATSSTAMMDSTTPILMTSTDAAVVTKMEDSAMPATIPAKDVSEAALQESITEKVYYEGIDKVMNNESAVDGDKTVTEIMMMASMDAQTIAIEEKEQMRPGIVLDGEPPFVAASSSYRYKVKDEKLQSSEVDENRNDNQKPSINCFAAIMLGIKCEIDGIDDSLNKNKKNTILPFSPLLPSKEQEEVKENGVQGNVSNGAEEMKEGDDKIMTVKNGLLPDRDEVFLNKPLFVSSVIPVPLEIINDEADQEGTEDDRNKITAVIENSTKNNINDSQRLRLPQNPLVSTLGQKVINLTDVKENNTGFAIKKVAIPARPLSVILSSNRINVELGDNNTEGANDENAQPNINITTLQTKTSVSNTNKDNVSEMSEARFDANHGFIDKENIILKTNNDKDKLSTSNTDTEEDLSKEPRVDIDQKKTTAIGYEQSFAKLPSGSQENDADAESNVKSEYIPTFYNINTLDMYSSSNTPNISQTTPTNSESNSEKELHNNQLLNTQNEKNDSSVSTEYTTETHEPLHEPEKDENTKPYRIPANQVCGKLGGAAIFQAFGKLTAKLMPDLVKNWVTGQSGQRRKSYDKRARIELDGEFDKHGTEPRIIAGDVTSTIMYCWMAAIVEILPDNEGTKFICTGALVREDLVITSASCTHRLFERGSHNFIVVLGDANLNIDLPFGVQNHEIGEVIVHENYRPEDQFHYEDIGLIKLKAYAKLQNTICLLCLPEANKDYQGENCTVTGYGKPSKAALNKLEYESKYQTDEITDGILRKAVLPVVQTHQCSPYLDMKSKNYVAFSGFLCAGGIGEEESCYVALDGGSPLACESDKSGHFELAGLVTFGTSCSQDKSPSLFTNVSKYLRWINDNYKATKKR